MIIGNAAQFIWRIFDPLSKIAVAIGALWVVLGFFAPWWSGWQSALVWSAIASLLAVQVFFRGMAESLWLNARLSLAIAVRAVQILIGFVPLALTFHFAG